MKNLEIIREKANWCLNCKLKPCSLNGCPMETRIPEFIQKIKNDEFKEAYKILMDNNLFSHICSFVCPQEEQCEGSCIRALKQTPTQIGELERFVNEWAIENKIDYKISKKQHNNKRVAIIGSGPAGLECAIELLKNGYDITIYEKQPKVGGILWYGIPDFRLPRDIVERVIEKVKKLGAKINTNTEFGKDIKLEELRKQYDYVFIGIGCSKSTTYSLSDKKADNIYKSDEFLEAYNEGKYIKKLGHVVVIGGGNVAMDTARVAVRMGAESVKILYRRDKEHMPAREIELEDALKDNVEFIPLTRVISANIENKKIQSVNCIKTEIVEGKAVDIDNSNFLVEANTVVFAIGLKPEKSILEKEKLKLNEWGMIEVDEKYQTNLEGVFAGGDVVQSKSTVCRALADGKKVALEIIKLDNFKEE